MEEKEVVYFFMKEGFQISQKALPLVKENPRKILENLKKLNPRPFIITQEHIEKIKKETYDKKPVLKSLLKYQPLKGELKVEDYSKFFLKIYETLRPLIEEKKLERLISANKIGKDSSNFSLIVSVIEKNENRVYVEDPTDELSVIFEDKKNLEEIEEGDVIGIFCKKIGEKIYAREIFYPQIPLTREINRTRSEIKLIFLYKPSLLAEKDFEKLIHFLGGTKKNDPIFVYGDWNDILRLKEFQNVFLSPENFQPEILEIDGITILVCNQKQNQEKIVIKRIVRGEAIHEIFPLSIIPDIILTPGKITSSKNYMGSTLFSLSSPNSFFIVDLKTREWEEKNISYT